MRGTVRHGTCATCGVFALVPVAWLAMAAHTHDGCAPVLSYFSFLKVTSLRALLQSYTIAANHECVDQLDLDRSTERTSHFGWPTKEEARHTHTSRAEAFWL